MWSGMNDEYEFWTKIKNVGIEEKLARNAHEIPSKLSYYHKSLSYPKTKKQSFLAKQ